MLSKKQDINVTQPYTTTLSDTTTLVRDSFGRVTRVTYPSGTVVDVAYSGDQVSSINVNGANLLGSISYLPFSATASGWRWGNGSNYSRSFDLDGRVTSVSLGSVQRSYQYDAAGQIAALTDTSAQGTQTSTIDYDEAGQLKQYNGPQGSQQFSYDANGNRKSETINGVGKTYSYAAGTNRSLGTASQPNYYNLDGTPWKYRGINIGYGLFGNLTNISISSDISNNYTATDAAYKYDAFNLRVLKTVNVRPYGQPDNYVSDSFFYDDSGKLLSEARLANTGRVFQDYIWFGGAVVGVVSNGQLHAVNSDNLTTPRSVVNLSSGQAVWRWESDPFGATVPTGQSISFNLRFPGQYYDSETGLYYNVTRYYDSLTGRYIQPDTIGLAGGHARYTYVYANPLLAIDPNGQAGIGDLFMVLGILYGGWQIYDFFSTSAQALNDAALAHGALVLQQQQYGLLTSGPPHATQSLTSPQQSQQSIVQAATGVLGALPPGTSLTFSPAAKLGTTTPALMCPIKP